MCKYHSFFIPLIIFILVAIPRLSNAVTTKDAAVPKPPTLIDADQLTLNSESRTFQYLGNVKVTQGDLTLIAEQLDGRYTEKNEIEGLTALRQVSITKGPDITARSEKAVYDAKQEMVVLTENPELTQKGSTLSADVVKIFLKENKSTAEGSVRVKVVDAQALSLDQLQAKPQ